MKRLSSALALGIAAATFAVACQTQKRDEATKDRQAPADAGKSFSVQQRINLQPGLPAGTTAASADSHIIRLRKDSLGKVFLLLPSMKTAGQTAKWQDFAPVGVVFEKSGKSLGLFELPSSVYDVIKPESLLGTFTIAEETADDIAFEWSLGLNSLPMRSHYSGIMDSEKNKSFEQEGLVNGVTVKDTFVRKAALENNELRIEQVSRVQTPTLLNQGLKKKNKQEKELEILTQETSFVVDLHIRPYIENKRFQKRLKDPERRIDFFAINTLEKGKAETVPLAVHWDISPESGPINVLISPETPAAYRDSVKEGALYWNRAFGREVLRVQDGAVTTSPTDRAITIRWVPWEDAGFAYASMQSDPFTGEVLRAQVFMTSSFVGDDVATPRSELSGAGRTPLLFKRSHLCELYPGDIAPDRLDDDVTQSEAQKRDMVRLVIAHEVGHTMGFRHNFAGSLGAAISTEEIDKQTALYRKDANHPGVPVESSVMDYLRSVHFSAIGRWIKSNMLPYDQMGIDYLQTGKITGTIPPFCSDDEVMAASLAEFSIYDCSPTDWGTNPLQAKSLGMRSALRGKIASALDTFFSSQFPKDLRTTEPATFEKALTTLESSDFAIGQWDLTFLRSALFTVIKEAKETDSMTSMKAIKKITPTLDPYANAVEINDNSALTELLKKDLASSGGVAQILRNALHLTPALTFEPNWASNEVALVLSRYPFKSGKTQEGVAYAMTDEQVAKIKETVTAAATKNLNAHLSSVVSQLFPGPGYDWDAVNKKVVEIATKLRPDIMSSEDSSAVADIAILLMSSPSKKLPIQMTGATEIEVPALTTAARKVLISVFDSAQWRAPIDSAKKEKLKALLYARVKLVASTATLTPATTSATGDSLTILKERIQLSLTQGHISGELSGIALADIEILEKLQ